MSTLDWSIAVLIASTIGVFLAGLLTRNYSHVDRLWSVLPAVYVIIWWQDLQGDTTRFTMGAILVVLWATRLSLNFARRGGYNFSLKKGFYEEDYRWPILKEKIPNRFLFELFNLTFISSYQMTLIFGFTLPLYFVGKSGSPITSIDITLFILHALFLTIETIADNQQWNFHKKKRSAENKDNPRYQLGFNTTGLWRFSRHPNYLMEMGQWVIVWCYTVQATQSWHLSGIAVALLILLFVGSTIMAENITKAKYPKYKEWQKATPPWVPLLDYPIRKKAREEFWLSLRKDDGKNA